MKYTVYHEKDMSVSKWTGGTTKQLAIYPEDGNYLQREFIWRLSSATVEQEESVFSKLPDFNRVLMVLEGDVVLAHQDVRVARLKQYEQDRFDGAYKTTSFGQITDYNLMTRKGNEGFLTYIPLSQEPAKVKLTEAGSYQKYSVCFYCPEGYGVITLNGQPIMLSRGDQLVIDAETNESYTLTTMGDGGLIQAEVYYNEACGEFGPTIVPKKPVSLSDWKECLYLANSQFRGASFIFKRKREEWIDEELGKVVNTLEKSCATMILFVIGLMILIFASYKTCTDGQIIGLAALWLVIDSLVFSPLIYLIFVPKPVRGHIKKISQLTPYEQRVKNEQDNAPNLRIQKILDNSITGNDNFTGAKFRYKK